jgi:hypothetical protein
MPVQVQLIAQYQMLQIQMEAMMLLSKSLKTDLLSLQVTKLHPIMALLTKEMIMTAKETLMVLKRE